MLRPEDGVRAHETEVTGDWKWPEFTGGCESPELGTGNQTRLPLKSNPHS